MTTPRSRLSATLFSAHYTPRGARRWLVPFVLESAMALLFAAEEYSVASSYGITPVWWRFLAKAAVFCSPWAILAPGVGWLVQRGTTRAWQRWKMIGAWLIVSSGASLLQSTMMEVFARSAGWPNLRLSPDATGPFLYEVARRSASTLAMTLMQILLIALAYHAVQYYRERQARILVESELEARLAEAELSALRTQLQPHFLFNTLNTISALMRTNVDTAQQVVARLGDLLRASLDGLREQQVSLEEELAFLNLYLDIQRARLGDRLTWRLELQRGTDAALVPSLLLQPLVENAFRHGIEPKTGAGYVSLRVTREASTLVIEIVDDGVGIGSSPLRDGIGLRNTRERLARLYDQAWRLNINAGAQGGTIVRIELPFEIDERSTLVTQSA